MDHNTWAIPTFSNCLHLEDGMLFVPHVAFGSMEFGCHSEFACKCNYMLLYLLLIDYSKEQSSCSFITGNVGWLLKSMNP